MLVGGEAVAQSGDADSEEAQGSSLSVPVALAVRVERPPVLDGRVVDDPTWLSAEPATGFRQTRPDEGQPATQRTEVRIVYTEDTLYFGVVCFDTDPNGIIMSDSRRDSSLNDTDSFQIVLDTYRDQQNGFVFGTNPAGLEFDGQLVNEGQGGGRFGSGGGRTQGGAGGGFNLNWDGSWQVATQISEIGWSAEFAIPFRTIRYPSGQSQTWSMMGVAAGVLRAALGAASTSTGTARGRSRRRSQRSGGARSSRFRFARFGIRPDNRKPGV